jgi:hypothetical protein
MKRFFCIIPFALGLVSCEKEIPFNDPGAEPRIVIGSFISPQNSNMTVELSKSESILADDSFVFLNDASVELYENNSLLGAMNPTEDGVYVFDQNPVAGNKYSVKVSHPTLPSVSAETTIPLNLVNASIAVETINDIDQYNQRITLAFDDNPNEKNYYQLLLYFNYDMQFEEYLLGWSTNSEILRNSDSGSGDSEFFHLENAIFSDDLFNGNRVSIPINSSNYIEGANVILRLMHVSEDYYLYRSSVWLQLETGDNPFAQPVPIHTNITDGYGIFASYNYQNFIVE